MRLFAAPECESLVAFDSTTCPGSTTPLVFDWRRRAFATLAGSRACVNRALIGCNGTAVSSGDLCASCALTRTRPAGDDPAGMRQWADVEREKRHLLFEVLELGLAVDGYRDVPGGLAFDLLSMTNDAGVMTGYADGTITLNLTEADSVYRERTRLALAEPHRSVLGHLRHEIGHFFQARLAAPGSKARERCRSVMGDDTRDYATALEAHYAAGPPADWRERHVSAYASSHPVEDWAETFAHYLRIRDAVQTAAAHNVIVGAPGFSPSAPEAGDLTAALATWTGLVGGVNAVARSLGTGADLADAVIAPVVAEKLALVDDLVRGRPG